MPEDSSGTSALLTAPNRFNVQWWSYDDWALWRFEDMETLSPVSLEKEEPPDPERFGMSGTKFKPTAFYRAIHTMGEAEQDGQRSSTSQAAKEEDSPEAAVQKAVSRLQEAVFHLEPLRGSHSGCDNLDPVSDFIGEDTRNLSGARKTLQDLLTGDHEVKGVIAENLAGWMQENQDTLAEVAANHLAKLLLSYYMQEVAATIQKEAEEAVGGENQTAEAMGAGRLSGEELIGVPSSRKEGDLEDLQWEGPHPAPCRSLVGEYLEGRTFEGCASFIAYHISVTLARDAFEAVEGTTPSDGEIESYVQGCSGEALFKYAAKVATRTVGFAVLECLENEGLSADWIEELLDVEAAGPPTEAPAPRPETEEVDPYPFSGGAADVLSNVFTFRANQAVMEADGKPAPTYKGEWGQDSTGHPIRVEQLGNPYEGRATFKVQALGEPDPAAVEASMGWKMLDRMDMDTVWLNLLLLSYASATHRRGDRPVIRIGRRTVEKVFGYRNGNYTMEERAKKIRRHVEALQSIFVQFQNVRRHGDKLHFKGDMAGGAPLWNLRMVAEGKKDLWSGETVANWHLEAREGLWATEFLHNHGDQFTPLPKEWFKKIDRRGSRNYAQRLAAYLLFQFRINSKNGARVKRRAGTLLEVCGEDMEETRDTRRRSELKRCLSKALDTLNRDYGIEVHADRVHMDQTSGMNFDAWKNRTVEFAPPASIEGRIFQHGDGDAPPLPDIAGDWKPKQIRHLRTEIVDETQEEFGDRMDVSKQYISQLERGTSDPSTRIRKRLDALHSRYS